jgi:hypothetical protein
MSKSVASVPNPKLTLGTSSQGGIDMRKEEVMSDGKQQGEYETSNHHDFCP